MAGPEKKYGRYRLLRKIGSGSMGDVLLARAEGPEGFARLCAIKRVRGTHAEDPTYVKMFIDEARLVAQLSHPGIIQIFELGREREGYFLAMEYVHGKSLRSLQRALLSRSLTVSPEVAAYITTRILAALAYVHDAKSHEGVALKLIHRDVKPENVLLSFHGDVKLADFGIARSQGQPGLTQTGAIRGTLPYVTPEQISSGSVTPLIDVWAAGVVLYELLAGERPFRGKGDFETARSILRDTPVPLVTRNPTVPPQLAAVVDRALQKDPTQRYQTAREMAAALEPLLIAANGRPVTDTDVSRALRETFPDEPDSPMVDRIGEPIPESESVEVVVEPSDSTTTAFEVVDTGTSTRSDRPMPASPARRGAFALVAAAFVSLGLGAVAAWWLTREPVPSPIEPPRVVQVPPDAGQPVGVAVVDAGAPSPPPPAPEPVDAGAALAKHTTIPAANGAIDLIVKPWAVVTWKGKSLGTTPLFNLSLPAGEQVLLLTNPELKLERKVKVKVEANRLRRVTVDLEDGR